MEIQSKVPDFQLFSSLRYDPILLQSPANTALWPDENGGPSGPSPFYMLPYHRDRMLQAARHFHWDQAISRIEGPQGLNYLLSVLESAIEKTETSSLRVRTLLHHNGDITVETSPIPTVPYTNLFPSRIPPLGSYKSERELGDPQQFTEWLFSMDPHRTAPSSFTSYKTTSRDMYTFARERVGMDNMADPKEVFLVSEQDNQIMEGSLTTVFFWRNGKWITPPITSGGQIGTTRRWLLEKGFCHEEIISADNITDGEECWISNGVRGLNWGRVKL